MKKIVNVVAAALLAGVVSVPAFAAATPPDMTALTSAVDFSTVTAAVLAVAALLATVYVAIKGASMALSMIRR